MLFSNIKGRRAVSLKALTTLLTIVCAVALPQLCHLLGIVSGTGKSLGNILLPMHIAILFAGIMAGATVGCVAGALSPVVSCLISGMPNAITLPFMIIELAVYGLVTGLLCNSKMPCIIKLLIAQILGRVIRAVAIIIAVKLFNYQGMDIALIWSGYVKGVFGIILQLSLLPLLQFYIQNKMKKSK